MICFTLYSVRLLFRGRQRNKFNFKVTSNFKVHWVSTTKAFTSSDIWWRRRPPEEKKRKLHIYLMVVSDRPKGRFTGWDVVWRSPTATYNKQHVKYYTDSVTLDGSLAWKPLFTKNYWGDYLMKIGWALCMTAMVRWEMCIRVGHS